MIYICVCVLYKIKGFYVIVNVKLIIKSTLNFNIFEFLIRSLKLRQLDLANNNH